MNSVMRFGYPEPLTDTVNECASLLLNDHRGKESVTGTVHISRCELQRNRVEGNSDSRSIEFGQAGRCPGYWGHQSLSVQFLAKVQCTCEVDRLEGAIPNRYRARD